MSQLSLFLHIEVESLVCNIIIYYTNHVHTSSLALFSLHVHIHTVHVHVHVYDTFIGGFTGFL